LFLDPLVERYPESHLVHPAGHHAAALHVLLCQVRVYLLISALLRVEVQKRKFFVKTSTIRGPPGRAGGRGKSKNKGRAGDEASNFLNV
jgi:hypothetical protein